ncbi:MAG: SPFH domain-containing protein, partial [Alphaproteobacteria bacterium]
AYSSVFIVDERQKALVIRLGEIQRTIDQPGIHFKMPIVEDAKAYKARVVNEAEGEAQRFISVFNQYDKAKDVTRKRLFLETLEEVLSKSNKVIIEQGNQGTGVVPYLALPEVSKRSKAAGGQATGGQ